jgi:GT2 family glycosyltransferase
MPKVSIIIPVSNQAHLTERCLASIEKYTDKTLFEVIVIDNASTDKTKEILENYKNELDLRIIRNERNKSFSESINQGADMASSEYLLLLNNDIYIENENWLQSMVDVLDYEEKTVIVGSKLLFPNKNIQHAGILFSKDKIPYHFCYNLKDNWLADIKTIVPGVTFACALIRKNVFDELNGLSTEYPDGNYEDVDFCLRARQKGYDAVYEPRSILYHEAGGTKKLDPKKARKTIEKNLLIFLNKWKDEEASFFEADTEKYPKVLVGCPTSDYKSYCLDKYAESAKNLTYPNYEILVVDNSKTEDYYARIAELGIPAIRSDFKKKARDRIVESRNLIRKSVLDEDYDYFLSLEQDIIPPTDIIEKLISHKKDIVAGVYFLVNPYLDEHKLRTSIWTNYNPETKQMFRVKNEFVLKNNVLMKIHATGIGCILMSRKVLEKIKFRYDKKTDGFDDMFFCKDARDNKFQIYADTGVLCKHLVENWSWEGIEK